MSLPERICPFCRVSCIDVGWAWAESVGAVVCSYCLLDIMESEVDPVDHEARDAVDQAQ